MHVCANGTIEDMQTVPRLIKYFVPEKYQLSVLLNRTDKTFGGTVTVQGETQPNSKSIILHSKELSIKSVVFDGKSAEFSCTDDDELIIKHPDLNVGKHIIVVSYEGKITDSMHGLYPCYYEHNDTKKNLLATQFESHSAREVFPCIDEPEAKATFDVTLTTAKDVTVLGNMPTKSQRIEDDNLVTTFETTPIMSSYLLAWVVGELHKKTARTKSGVEVNVWATPAQPASSLDFSLDIATRAIDFYDEYFDTPYPLSKCDHVALPDFAAGAMENWGLITYREVALLADPEKTSVSNKHYIATVIAHELSHQWFGNLVTMKWWNDLWLNESFASLIEYTATNALEPTWDMWLDFASGESVYALSRDSLAGVQSVQIDVNHPDEIGTLFDGAIVYAKGARLLQMLQHYIGEEAFRSGLKEYFKTYAYKNTEARDLWSAFGGVSDKDISSFMITWISQPGFPVLHVSKNDNKISLSQERLTSQNSSPSDTLWPIPLNSNCPDMPEIFDTKSLEIITDKAQNLRFNIGSYSHYITHYDSGLFNQIISQIKSGELQPIDRLQILNEQVLLAKAGIISNAELIPLLKAYEDETNESVWDIISAAIGELKKFVATDKTTELKFHSFVKSIASKQYARLGWDKQPNESETDTKLRSIIIGLMAYSEDSEVIATANILYSSKPLDQIDPELRRLILSVVAQHSTDSNLANSLLEIYKKTHLSQLQRDICYGLTSTRNTETITNLLNIAKDTSIIRIQDTAWWIVYLLHNKHGRELTWQWIRDNWNWIDKTFGDDKSYDDYPRYAANTLQTRKQLDEYREFFTPMQPNPALQRVIEIGINEISDRVELIERDSENVKKALLNL